MKNDTLKLLFYISGVVSVFYIIKKAGTITAGDLSPSYQMNRQRHIDDALYGR